MSNNYGFILILLLILFLIPLSVILKIILFVVILVGLAVLFVYYKIHQAMKNQANGAKEQYHKKSNFKANSNNNKTYEIDDYSVKEEDIIDTEYQEVNEKNN